MEKLSFIYKKSTINLAIAGVFIFGGICINSSNFFRIYPDFSEGFYPLIFAGLGFLMDMSIGSNKNIIANSKHYRYSTYINVVSGIVLIGTNILLIPIWGITGSAVAFLIAKFFQNFIRFIFVYKTWKLQPFEFNIIKLLAVFALAFVPALFLPIIDHIFNNLLDIALDIGIRSLFFFIAFFSLAYAMKISEDLNRKIKAYWSLIFK